MTKIVVFYSLNNTNHHFRTGASTDITKPVTVTVELTCWVVVGEGSTPHNLNIKMELASGASITCMVSSC